MSSNLFQERLASLRFFSSWAEAKETVLSRNLFAVDYKSNLLFCDSKNDLFLIDLRSLKTTATDEEIEHCVKNIHLKDNKRIDFNVVGIRFNEMGDHVCVYGLRQIVVIELPESPKAATTKVMPCRSWRLFEREFELSLRLRVTSVKWHSFSNHHLAVLLSDNTLRLFNISNTNRESPEQSFRLIPQKTHHRFRVYDSDEESDDDDDDNNEGYDDDREPTLSHSVSALTLHGRGRDPVVSFCFGGDRGWERFALFYTKASGKVYVLCPVIPYNCIIPREHVSNLIPKKKSRSRSSARSPSQSPSLRFGIKDDDDDDDYFDDDEEEEEEEEDNDEQDESYYDDINENNNNNNHENNDNDKNSLDPWILRYLEHAIDWRSVIYHNGIPFVKTRPCSENPFRPHNVQPVGPLPFARSTPLPLAEHSQRCDMHLIFNGVSTILLLDPSGGWVSAYVLIDAVNPSWRSLMMAGGGSFSFSSSSFSSSTTASAPELIEFEDLDLGLNANPNSLPFFATANNNSHGASKENIYVVHDGGVCLVDLPFVSHLPQLFRSDQITEDDVPETPSPAAVIRTKSTQQLGAYVQENTIPVAVGCISDSIVGIYLITLCIQSSHFHLDVINMDRAAMLASFTPIVTTEPPTFSHSSRIAPFDSVLTQDESLNVERMPRLVSDEKKKPHLDSTTDSGALLSSSFSSLSDQDGSENSSASLNLFLKTLQRFKHNHVVKIRQLQVHITDRLSVLNDLREKQYQELDDLQQVFERINTSEQDLASKYESVGDRQERLNDRAHDLLRRVQKKLSPLSQAERQYHRFLYKTKSRIKHMEVRLDEIDRAEEKEKEEERNRTIDQSSGEEEGVPTREQIRDVEYKLQKTFESLDQCCNLITQVRQNLNEDQD